MGKSTSFFNCARSYAFIPLNREPLDKEESTMFPFQFTECGQKFNLDFDREASQFKLDVNEAAFDELPYVDINHSESQFNNATSIIL